MTEREGVQAGGGVLGQALAQSSAIFLCAADKQNKMRARKNSRASISVFIYKFGA